MNKNINLLVTLLALLCFVGCGSLETTAYRTTGVVVVSVDKAMSAWGDYVRAGKATPDDQSRVRSAYEKYQSALHVERDAVLSYKTTPNDTALNGAISALSAASSDLVGLIEQFIPTLKTTP